MDNKFQRSPPKMQDCGRYLCDFSQSRIREVHSKGHIIRDDEYRLYLQHNAKQIMDNEWNKFKENYVCWNNNHCVFLHPTRSTVQELIIEKNEYDSRFYQPSGQQPQYQHQPQHQHQQYQPQYRDYRL